MQPKLDITQIRFTGLVRNIELQRAGFHAILHAIHDNGWKEGSGKNEPHFVNRLIDRGPKMGIYTLGHLENSIRRGHFRADDQGYTWVLHHNAYIAYDPYRGWLISLLFGAPGPERT